MAMDEVQIIDGVIIGLFTFLIGVIWYQLNNRIRKVEDWKVDKGYCKTRGLLLDERFSGIGARIGDMKDSNNRDHEKLDDQLLHMRTTMDEIRDCMVKLAGNKKC